MTTRAHLKTGFEMRSSEVSGYNIFMEQITTLLQGSYAYLLIFQILVVSALFMMLIMMIVKRLRLEVEEMGASTTAGGSFDSLGKGTVSNEEFEQLKQKFENVQEDLKSIDKIKTEKASLDEKVKFLESKLLEYEILQEEIGSLSNLKVENEKLKKELLVLQKDLAKTGAQIDQLVQEPTSPVTGAEGKSAPMPSTDGSKFPVEILGAEPSSTPPGTAAAPPLDDLLAEIDALSTTPPNPPK